MCSSKAWAIQSPPQFERTAEVLDRPWAAPCTALWAGDSATTARDPERPTTAQHATTEHAAPLADSADPTQEGPAPIRVLAVAVESAGRPRQLHLYTWWHPNFDADILRTPDLLTRGRHRALAHGPDRPRDGLPGIDISGRTMATYFEEVAGGRVTFDGGRQGAQAWVQVPHSMAYYAANACIDGVAGVRSTRRGLPSKPRWPNGTATLLEDIAAAINADEPAFPWAEYDTDGDNIIDRFQMIFAGMSRSVGGGSYGFQTIWAHRGSADANRGGIPVDDAGTPDDPNDDIRLQRYTAQAENTSLGTLVHEFGHDFGLADFYDTSCDGTSNVAWWDLMAYGGSTGAIRGSQPAHMSAHNKLLMGWTEPRLATPTAEGELIALGQTSNPPPGSEQSLRMEMPPSEVPFLSPPPGSSQMARRSSCARTRSRPAIRGRSPETARSPWSTSARSKGRRSAAPTPATPATTTCTSATTSWSRRRAKTPPWDRSASGAMRWQRSWRPT